MKTLNGGYRADGLGEAKVPAKPKKMVLDVPMLVEQVVTDPPQPAALTPNERLALEYWERDIRTNLMSFLRAGKALAQIRDQRLYRQDHSTFEEYCEKKWQISRAHAYRLIAEAGVESQLSPIGDKMPRPANEAQFRELAGLTPEQIPQAWKNAVTAAEGKPVTAKMVRQAAAEFKTAKRARKKSPNLCIDIVPIGGGKLGQVEDDPGKCIAARDIPIEFNMAILESEADIEDYVTALRKAFLDVVRSRKCIAL
jgi:hypothetical protein